MLDEGKEKKKEKHAINNRFKVTVTKKLEKKTDAVHHSTGSPQK